MRILAVSDHIDPLVYSQGIKERFGDVSIVVGAGDLPLDYYDFIATSLNKPLVFVFGNHNLRYLHRFRKPRDCFEFATRDDQHGAGPRPGGIYADRRVVRVKGLLIAGLGGSPWYNGGENQYTDRQMAWRVLRLVPALMTNRILYGRFLDILLTHAPPLGIQDRPDRTHRGFKALVWFMRRFRPRYLIHGHVHLYDRNESRATRFHQTTVVNAYDHAVIDVDGVPHG